MPTENNGVLPPDPQSDQPIIMGDAYDGKTPKTAQEKNIAEHTAGEASGVFRYGASTIAHHPDPWMKTAQMGGVNSTMTNPMWFSPLHTPQNWQIASKRREVYQWNRFWYDNEPKVAAAIDFYSRFPMNGFRLECPSKQILSFFEQHVVKKLKLNVTFKQISSEYFMLGDVFAHLNVACEHCHGSGTDPDSGERCDHKGGSFNRILILNPDWIEVQQSPLVDEPSIVLNPDEELKNIVFYKQPKAIYDRIPGFIKDLVIQGKPIPLSNRTTHHLKHMPVPYGTYGTSLSRRLFTTLAYKTKIMTANWIVAERLILPVRVVKVGNDTRPASSADIADIQQQLSATANDPNLTIVTHHAFEYDWFGATGKILQVTQELEWIGKEILDGFMLSQALLNGEAQGYQSAQVGVETLIRRIESWRHTLAEWAEEHIFEPIAKMHGFIDEEKSAETGDKVYLYPTIKWNDLELKDKTQWHQLLTQLHDKQVISTQTLMEELDLNYDQEVKRMRYEQMQAGPGGAPMGGGAGGMGAAGGGAAAGGGMGGDMGGGMGMGGDMGGGMGGDMGGGMGGDMGGGGMSPAAGGQKVMKKGKGEKQEQQPMPMAFVKLTQIEQKMAAMLEDVASVNKLNPGNIRAQFPIENPNGGKRFQLDFAIPNIKLGIEADGEVWHSNPEQESSDKERDYLLAQRGWTILRFDDKVIDDAPQSVKQTIGKYIRQAVEQQQKKTAGTTSQNGDIHLFTARSNKVVDFGTQYEKYFATMAVHTTGEIGSRGIYQNVSYKNSSKQSEVFGQ